MTFSSLPDYRDLSSASIDRRGADVRRPPMDRFFKTLFNLALLGVLWGLPYYLRSIIVSTNAEPGLLPEVILGRWQTSDYRLLEFTSEGQIRLFRMGSIIEKANYQLRGDKLTVSDFKRQPGNHPLPTESLTYRISIHGERMLVSPSDTGFSPPPRHSEGEGSYLRTVLPPFLGSTRQFRREDAN